MKALPHLVVVCTFPPQTCSCKCHRHSFCPNVWFCSWTNKQRRNLKVWHATMVLTIFSRCFKFQFGSQHAIFFFYNGCILLQQDFGVELPETHLFVLIWDKTEDLFTSFVGLMYLRYSKRSPWIQVQCFILASAEENICDHLSINYWHKVFNEDICS